MKLIRTLLLGIICFSTISCRQNIASAPISDDVTGNFKYSTAGSRRLITMSIPIGTEYAEMIFDSGGLGLLLDSDVATKIFNMKKLERKTKILESSVFFPALSRDIYGKTFFYPVDIPFFGRTLHYDWFMVCDGLKDEFAYDGIFSIPQNDSHIWNFDFENLSITISDADSFSRDLEKESDFTCDVVRSGEKLRLIDFPISFSHGTDSISIKQEVLFDTGCSSAIVFNRLWNELEEERQFIENNSILCYKSHIGDDLSLIYSPGFVNDTLLVTFKRKDQSLANTPHFLGVDFLARFNVFIDLKNEKAYFKRNGVMNLANYVNENSSVEKKALILIPGTGRETALVTSIGDESPAYKAGVRQYDIIEKFDGGTFASYNAKYAMMRQRGEGETFTFDINRFGEKRTIQFFWPITE